MRPGPCHQSHDHISTCAHPSTEQSYYQRAVCVFCAVLEPFHVRLHARCCCWHLNAAIKPCHKWKHMTEGTQSAAPYLLSAKALQATQRGLCCRADSGSPGDVRLRLEPCLPPVRLHDLQPLPGILTCNQSHTHIHAAACLSACLGACHANKTLQSDCATNRFGLRACNQRSALEHDPGRH